MTDIEIQELAEELVEKRNNPSEAERVRAIQTLIAEYECSLVKELGNGKAFFPLLKRFNGKVEYTDFWDVLIDALMKLFETYDPEKGASFTTMLSRRLDWDLLNLYTNDSERNSKEYSLNEMRYRDGEDGADNTQSPADADIPDDFDVEGIIMHPSTPFEVFMCVAELVSELKKQEQHLSKSKRSYFEGFFTFDTTEQTRKGLFFADDVLGENEILFPIMEKIILEYLMTGIFTHMRDVICNPLKDVKLLDKRGEVIGACYGISKPTVAGRNARYRQLYSAISA